jgi:formamidopyrimidine-DNA glycosylase
MPELPEVETVRRRLAVCLPGLLLRRVVVNDPLVSEQSAPELRRRLEGRRVTGLRRRGKYLIVDLGPREEGARADEAAATVAVVHLRMTGQLLFQPAPATRPPRFVWRLEPGAELSFQDVRRFGRLWALTPHQEAEFFAWMGPEPFGDEFTVAYLRRALQGRSAPLKSFLLDQRRIAGVGNIYADEALFRARLHPLRAAGSVGPREAQRLHAAVLETLQAGIDHEGSSIESFVDPAGVRGSFQQMLNVYQRTGEPCRVCGATVRRTVVGNRGTHFCPHCQPARGGMAPSARRRPSSDVPVRGKAPDFAAPDDPAGP